MSEYDKLVNVVREQVDKLTGSCHEVVTRHDLQRGSLSDIVQEKGVSYHGLPLTVEGRLNSLKKELISLAKAHGLDQRTRWVGM